MKRTEFLIIVECLDSAKGDGFFAEFSVVDADSESAVTRLQTDLERQGCKLVSVESVEVFAQDTKLEASVEQMSGRSYFSGE